MQMIIWTVCAYAKLKMKNFVFLDFIVILMALNFCAFATNVDTKGIILEAGMVYTRAIAKTLDGNYLILCYLYSGPNGLEDVLLAKIDSTYSVIATYIFGG